MRPRRGASISLSGGCAGLPGAGPEMVDTTCMAASSPSAIGPATRVVPQRREISQRGDGRRMSPARATTATGHSRLVGWTTARGAVVAVAHHRRTRGLHTTTAAAAAPETPLSQTHFAEDPPRLWRATHTGGTPAHHHHQPAPGSLSAGIDFIQRARPPFA